MQHYVNLTQQKVNRQMKKLKQYFKLHGVRQTFFSENLGISGALFAYYVNGDRKIPPKYWRKIHKLTNGYITIDDFLDDAERK